MPKSEPQSYYASNESIKIPDPAVLPPEMQEPVFEADPLTSFERLPFQVQTDLRLWMTFIKKDRLKKAAWWAGPIDDSKREKGIDPRYQQKILLTIISMESTHPRGDYTVAAIAFKGLPFRNKEEEKVNG